jgi:hypothetical protein
MASRIFKAFLGLLVISIAIAGSIPVRACSFYELQETYRLSVFRAELPGMAAFRPFYYSADYFNSYEPDPEAQDAKLNCIEWQKYLGRKVTLHDIDFILYKTPPEIFEAAFQSGKLSQEFKGNTFIMTLMKKRYAAELQYLCFSKELEYLSFNFPGNGSRWESWNDQPTTNYGNYNSNFDRQGQFLDTVKSEFLKLRYAFQLIKLNYYETNNAGCIAIYDKYFERLKTREILKPWALFFKAKAIDRTGNGVLANYLYSLSFDQCDEKKVAIMQAFHFKPTIFEQTILKATNDYEKGVIKAILLMNDPGPTLDKLKIVRPFLLKSKYFAPLVMREINKLEDWINTPKYTHYGPAVNPHQQDYWWQDYNKVRSQNLETDLAYLWKFREFLIGCLPEVKGETRDYLHLAIAHLSYMNNEFGAATEHLNMLPEDMTSSMNIQKRICISLISLGAADLQSGKVQAQLVACIRDLERDASKNSKIYKCLYSLLRITAAAYKEKGFIAEAGLMVLKSERYKQQFEAYSTYYYSDEDEWTKDWRYFYIAWFDRNAGIFDIDRLIGIIKSKKKNSLQKYLCKQTLPSVYDCYDLRATLAFRNNDLAETRKSLEKVPEKYYRQLSEFRQNLNENPFYPKCFDYVRKREFNYPFSKMKFINTLIELKKSTENGNNNHSEEYIRLGHAYFNCSWFGNSWMMVAYGAGSDYYEFNDELTDDIFGSTINLKKSIQSGNYYNLSLAREYYSKALKCPANDEQKAMANLMIHICDYYSSRFRESRPNDYGGWAFLGYQFFPGQALEDFYFRYNQTEVFNTYRCPLLDDFMGVYEPVSSSIKLSE